MTRYHTQSRGWHHAGYHILITPDGKAHVLWPLDTIGVHAGVGARLGKTGYNNNRETIGIAISGALHEHKPTEEAVSKLFQIIALLANMYMYKNIEYIEGHGKMPGCATACLGKFMPIDKIQIEFEHILKNGSGSTKPVEPPIEPKGDNILYRVITAPCSNIEDAMEVAERLRKQGKSVYVHKKFCTYHRLGLLVPLKVLINA